MGDNSLIEWTDASWPIVTGCEWASRGCDRCYAAKETAGRLSGHPRYKSLAVRVEGAPARFTGEVRLNRELLDQPLRWRRPRMIFVSSMGDIWHPDVPRSFLVEIFAVMALAHWHTFQVLTKRPQRQRQVLSSEQFWMDVAAECTRLTGEPAPFYWRDKHLPNAWLGTSIEERRWATRARYVRQTPAALRFLSVEPLLMDVAPSLYLTGISWVIVGGESGRDAYVRPMHPQWVRNVRDLCAAQGVAFFFKQWGEYVPRADLRWSDVTTSGGTPEDGLRLKRGCERFRVVEPEWACGVTHAGNVVMERVGKKAAGALLDGREHRQMPAAVAA